MCGTSWFEYPCQAQRCRAICLLYKHWAHAMEAGCAFYLIPISRARRLLGRLSRLSGTWWSLRAITSLSMLFAPSHFDWNPGTPYWSTGTGLVFLQYTDVVTPFCIFYIFAEAFHLPCSGGYTLLLSRNLIDGFLYNSELMEKDLLCIHALFRLTRFVYVQTLYKRSFECMTLELAHDHLKRVLPERSILSCASMSCSDGYILLLSYVDVMKKQCAWTERCELETNNSSDKRRRK